MLIAAPENSPQTPIAQPLSPSQLKLDPLDLELLNAIRRHGRYGEHPWKVINEVAAMQPPDTREKARSWRLALWGRLKGLMRAKVVFRFSRAFVTTSKIPPLERQPRRRPRKRNVRRSGGHKAGSTIDHPDSSEAPKQQQPVQSKAFGANSPRLGTVPNAPKTKSAPETAGVSAAANALARLPRNPKRRWTGWLGDSHLWKGAQVVLPSGRVATLYGALRTQIVVLKSPNDETFPPLELYPANQVKRWKNPNAAVLGRLKRGIREHKSVKKRRSCQCNGRRFVRPGHRPRGRPKAGKTPTDLVFHSS